MLWGGPIQTGYPIKEGLKHITVGDPSRDYQKKALQGYHDDIGHLGIEQMLDLLQDQFYWPGMKKDAELHIAKCEQCIK